MSTGTNGNARDILRYEDSQLKRGTKKDQHFFMVAHS